MFMKVGTLGRFIEELRKDEPEVYTAEMGVRISANGHGPAIITFRAHYSLENWGVDLAIPCGFAHGDGAESAATLESQLKDELNLLGIQMV